MLLDDLISNVVLLRIIPVILISSSCSNDSSILINVGKDHDLSLKL